MSSSLQRLKNRLTGNVLGASNATNTTTGPDLSRGANSNTDTSHLNLDKDPFDYAVHQYPEDLGNNDFGHYILFHIYERHNSSYVGPMKSYAAGGRSNPSSGSGGPPGRDYGGTQGEKALEGLVYSSKTAHSKNIIPEDEDTFILRAEGEGSRPGYSTSHNLRQAGKFVKSKDTIALYLPPNLSYSYSHDYKNSETGLAGLVAQTVGVTAPDQSLVDILSNLGDEQNINTAKSVLGDMGFKKLALKVGEFVGLGEGTEQLGKILNEAPNPALEAIFTGTGFRTFSYSFRFTPRTENEVRVVDDIVRTFKFHAAPERMYGEKVGRHFRMPAEFDIFYMYQGKQNKWYPMIHSCVCNKVDVSYGPGGEAQHFRPVDGSPAPTETNMTLEFTETEVMTKDMIKVGF